MQRFARVTVALLALAASAAGQDGAAEWIWDAPNERWVQPADVRRFVSADEGGTLAAGFARRASAPGAAAPAEQDLTLPGGLDAQPRGRIVLRGQLEALRVVSLAPGVGRGPTQDHTLGLIGFEDGRAALVDLGPSAGLEGLPLALGARVVVRAVQGHIDGLAVLMAERLHVGGVRREVDWAAGWRGEPERPAPVASAPAEAPAADLSRGAGSQMLVRGEVAAVREVDADGRRRRAAELVAGDGRRVLLLLADDARDLGAGDRVVVRGRWARLGDQQALTADLVERE